MILIFPFARPLRNNQVNAKNYPYWSQLIDLIDKNLKANGPIIQIGTEGERQLVSTFYKNLSLKALGELVDICDTWIGVDSFGQHFCWDRKKYGIVLWGKSDPLIFGHEENINLLKNRKYFRQNQFFWWEDEPYNEEAFVQPKIVLQALIKQLHK